MTPLYIMYLLFAGIIFSLFLRKEVQLNKNDCNSYLKTLKRAVAL